MLYNMHLLYESKISLFIAFIEINIAMYEAEGSSFVGNFIFHCAVGRNVNWFDFRFLREDSYEFCSLIPSKCWTALSLITTAVFSMPPHHHHHQILDSPIVDFRLASYEKKFPPQKKK